MKLPLVSRISVFLALSLVSLVPACKESKAESGTPASPTAEKAPTTGAAPAATPVKEAARAQVGVEKGEVIVGYLQDLKDEGQCAALPAKESEKAKFDQKGLEEMAKMMKAKVVDKCPDTGVQGTCKSMGMLVNYTAPKYTVESAKKDCTANHGKWLE
jgi:hypothetical protein